MRIPIRYLPSRMTEKDRRLQLNMILKSRQAYKTGKYQPRKKLKTFRGRKTGHLAEMKRIYGVDKIVVNQRLSQLSGCSLGALQRIVKKGQGAFYSSGSRPNQTGHSWGLARLASSLTGGKASAVDFAILRDGCKHSGKAFRLAQQSLKKWKWGRRKAKTIKVKPT